MLSFKPAFSLSSFTFIKRLFSSSSPSAIIMVSSAYPRLLIFLPSILTPACDLSSLAFHVIISVFKLNKQGTINSLDVLLSQFGSVCCSMSVLSVASCPVYRFLRRQIYGLAFPSLEEYFTVCYDPHSQRL